MGDRCFEDCGIEDFKCPKSIKAIPAFGFNGCKSLRSFYGGDNIKILEHNAFHDCEKLIHFSFSETLEEINKRCFANTSIKLFVIPSSVKSIDSETFNDHISSRFAQNDKVTLVILGKEAEIVSISHETLCGVSLIYCLPGSKAQRYAREHNIPMKPLSEFNAANYNA